MKKNRGKNIGTILIEKIEKCAKENNALGVRMENWNFQARGFYEKQGYCGIFHLTRFYLKTLKNINFLLK